MISGYEDLDEDPFRLNIIVEDTKDFTDVDVIRAAALSVVDFVPEKSSIDENSVFYRWVQGRFGKFLKRMKSAQYAKLSDELRSLGILHKQYVFGTVHITVMEPVRRSFSAPVYKRAQLSHLTVLDGEFDKVGSHSIEIFVNADLDMSVSKGSVAAAHALQSLRDTNTDIMISESSVGVIKGSIVEKDFDVSIHDAGLTEVTPDSITAAARIVL